MRFLVVPLLAVALVGLLLLMVIPIWIAVFFVFWRFLMPWLVVGLVIWAVFALSGHPRHKRWARYTYPTVPPPRPPAPRPPTPRPEHRPSMDVPQRPDLPIDVQVKVEQIRRKVEVLLSYASRFPPFSRDLYIVRQTANDYLPRTIDTFLALPPNRRELAVDATGKTALDELKDQLALLDSKLDEIAEDLQRQNLDRLLANRRFLEERFGRISS